jgi:hypothetical protein
MKLWIDDVRPAPQENGWVRLGVHPYLAPKRSNVLS